MNKTCVRWGNIIKPFDNNGITVSNSFEDSNSMLSFYNKLT